MFDGAEEIAVLLKLPIVVVEHRYEANADMRVFVLLMGFPGVGKLTIANELSTLVSAKVIDNHWFNNPIFRLLDDDGITPSRTGYPNTLEESDR